MVTVTTPSRLNANPSYQGLAGEPALYPPPWIHTNTGSPASARPGAGVNTLTFRIESPGMLGSGMAVTSARGRTCAVAPYSVQSRTPSHRAAGTAQVRPLAEVTAIPE